MKLIKRIFVMVFTLSISSCFNGEENKLIIGKWSGAEWLIDGQPSNRNTAETQFTFDDEGNYTFTYSGTEEKGTYKVENNMLFTTPENRQEIMVKITRLTKDSLVFDMNRSGSSEILTLLKK